MVTMRSLLIIISLVGFSTIEANYNYYYPRYGRKYPVYSYNPSYSTYTSSSSSSSSYLNKAYNSCSCLEKSIGRQGEVEYYAMCCRGNCPEHLPTRFDKYTEIIGVDEYGKIFCTVAHPASTSKAEASIKSKTNTKENATKTQTTVKSTSTTTEQPPSLDAPLAF
ncbi:uncharacterized protein LOC142237532 [Haematobia irritans]|uniref:uncharacterized protein LOC142237532 n=1 Tax=Haematobia irritans TaxID=7368 RepID=UPI003F4FED17